jgi:16S rRNA (uracil1498-N3)-methyltransferase
VTNALLTRAAATSQVLVDSLDALELSDDDRHHLVKVLRVRNGEQVIATDGRGNWRQCAWRDGLEVAGDTRHEPQTHVGEIAFALTKSDKPEWTVQKLTEIGIARIVPFVSARSIVKWDAAKAEKHVARFRRVAQEAAMQSRRVWLPHVAAIASFDDIVESGFALAAPGGDTAPHIVDKIAVGPEGGWDESELARARVRVSLGATILRAETAAVAAAVLLRSQP